MVEIFSLYLLRCYSMAGFILGPIMYSLVIIQHLMWKNPNKLPRVIPTVTVIHIIRTINAPVLKGSFVEIATVVCSIFRLSWTRR
jgi:hypothetical protein